MTPREMKEEAQRGVAAGSGRMTFVLPPRFKRPAGFPRGELLSNIEDRGAVWSFECAKVLAWLKKNEAELGLAA